MTRDRIVLHGQVYLSLPELARCFDVELSWVEEVYRFGLLGCGEVADGGPLIAAYHLERVSRIVRLHLYEGVNLEGVRLALGTVEVVE